MTETAEAEYIPQGDSYKGSAGDYKVSAFPVDQPAPALPVTVNAPIVIDAKTEEGCKPLLDYIESLKRHNNVEVAQAEEERLQPYFSAMSIYLTRALEKTDPNSELGHEKEALQQLTTPGGLRSLFNAMAEYARATLISDVVVMADDIRTVGPAQHLFEDWGEFKTNYDYNGHSFNFGFLQVQEDGNEKMARSGTTFPTLMLDHKMVEALPADEAAPLIRDYQGVMTLVNHDMLHHFTSSYISSNTVFKPKDKKSWGFADPVKEWSKTLPHATSGEAYEDWAQMGQEKVLLAPGNEALVEDVRAKLDHFMDGLERIRDKLLVADKGEPPSAEKIKQAHEVIDYFGVTMAHALTRVFPLNHDMMQHCLDRLQKADPTPEAALRDCARMLANTRPKDEDDPSWLLGEIRRKQVTIHLGEEMIKSYRALGCDVFPEDNKQVGYKNLKMVQLMKLGGLHAHAPVVDDKSLTQIRTNMEDITLKMVVAAANATKLKVTNSNS